MTTKTMTRCSVAECDRDVLARGWCGTHYRRWQRRGDPLSHPFVPRGTCSDEGCEKPHASNGYCHMHLARHKRHGDASFTKYPDRGLALDERLAKHSTRAENGCLLWTGVIANTGYGRISIPGRSGIGTHVLAWELANNRRVPEGLVLDHLCHNADPECPGGACLHRRCMEPSHLEPTTHGENTRRGLARLRLKESDSHF